ncbi:type III PLP-dependent enzyme [Maricaulis sp. CAU 1757]
MHTFHTPLDLVRTRHVESPVVCARPDRVAEASHWFQDNFPGEVLYAVKANPSPWVVDALYASGLRFFDTASIPEIRLVAERCPEATMAFLHPVKSRESIRRAYYEFGVRIFALDCEAELQKIIQETNYAQDLILIVRLAVSNDGAMFSLAGKFGVPAYEAAELIRSARAHADELGVSFHVGSQCMQPSAYRSAMMEASRMIAQAGVTVDIVDVGGGFPSIYPGMAPPPMSEYISAIEEAFEDMMVLENADLWCEPGRALVAEGESVLTRVELVKGDALYLNDGAYGRLFDAAHSKWPFPVRVHRANGKIDEETASFRFFGPTCDSMDAIPGPFELPADIAEGDIIEIGMLGAYGTALATDFNGFGAIERVMVEDMPWPSMFEAQAQPVQADDEGAEVINFARARRRRPKLRRRA